MKRNFSKKSFGLAMFLCFAAGCTSKSTDSTSGPATSEDTGYSLAATNTTKLESVGCHVKDDAAQCDPPKASQPGTTKLDDLKAKEKSYQAQIQALQEVQDSIQKEIDEKKLGDAKSTRASNIKRSLLLVQTSLVSANANNDVAISNEELFLDIVGYRCSGDYPPHQAIPAQSVPFKDDIYFSSLTNHDFVKNYTAAEPAVFSATLTIDQKTERVKWSSSQNLSPWIANNKAYVATGGEFQGLLSNNGGIRFGCYRLRLGGNVDGDVSDEPVSRSSIKCVIQSISTDPTSKAKFRVAGTEVFSTDSRDDIRVSQLMPPVAADEDASKAYYSLKATSNRGIVTYEIDFSQNGGLAFLVHTSNSTSSIAFGLSDSNGNSLDVSCETE